MNNRQLFLQHVGQTSDAPLCFEIDYAKGIYLYDVDGKKYIDAIGGISVANIGHGNENVIEATKKQLEKYTHTMVYGEMVQAPQVAYATMLSQHLPNSLNSVFFTNSGAEAIEGAMKLCKRANGRSKIFAFKNAYHGSTQGALSLLGDEYFKNAFRPLLPEIYHFDYNNDNVIEAIDATVAAIFVETIQAESGIIPAQKKWLQAIRKKCTETGTLMVLDECQCGFGRTGTLWAFEQYGLVPDMVVLAKALGGGMPLGAFIANKTLMDLLSFNPVLGHITTFGGHPVCCASGLASMQVLLQNNIVKDVEKKGALIKSLLHHPKILKVQQHGLWAAVFFKDFETNKKIIDTCIANGVFTDWFLFASNALRISPPLTITEDEIKTMCEIILKSIS